MESFLQKQCEIIESIKQIERNFGKDAASRKTRKYINERLDTLDRLWAEFQSNNDKLAMHTNDYDPYFTENNFEKTRRYFDSVRMKVAASPTVSELRSKSPSANPLSPQPVETKPSSVPGPSVSVSQADYSSRPRQAIELLSLQRTNFRAFTRLLNSLNEEEIKDKWELEDELKEIQSRWKVIDSQHIQIDNILQGSDSLYDEEFCAHETSYKMIKRALNKKLASTAHLQQSTPQIDIPIFAGKYTQWPTFYDLYVESIHSNNLLTDSQKMQHLKSKLRGEAERLIQHLNITTENYNTAWDLLTHRYNNPQLLFTKQIETFLNQPSVQKQTAYEIRRLFDTTSECVHAIKNLGIETKSWDPILVHLIAKKLDIVTYSDYKESRKSPRDLPTLSELMNFLEAKFTALEPIHKKEQSQVSPKYVPQKSPGGIFHRHGKYPNKEYQAIATSANTSSWHCPLCKTRHCLYKCNKFNKLSPETKLKTIRNLSICDNCLFRHNDGKCNSARQCKICQGNHNTILHDAIMTDSAGLNRSTLATQALMNDTATSNIHNNGPSTASTSTTVYQSNRQHNVNHVAADDEEVLLTTLAIKVKDRNGTYVTFRALLDQGSQISLISENAAQVLGLTRQNYHASVTGIGYGSKQSKGIVKLECSSIYDDYQLDTQALIINRVINNLPNTSFAKQRWNHLDHVRLADPDYNISKPIDILLDATVYSDIIMSGLIKANKAPIAQQTKLGWILSGNVRTFNCHVVINNYADLTQYWELEDIQENNTYVAQDEQLCEKLYKDTTRRLPDGRYEVAIPMKPGFEQNLGTSKSKAIAQFYNLEQRMKRNETFSESYKQFMREYEEMNHMTRVPANTQTSVSCYLPHHGVLKLESTTTKLRTVFNASSKTSSGHSLNDLMERGPNLQRDLLSLILAWRQHKYVITADIEKMFRQIMIREPDQNLQRIVWRYSVQEPIQEFQLATITYGTKSAPYLAMRTLKQLAIDGANKFPLAAKALTSSFYMDDLLEGGPTVAYTKRLQKEIIEILKEAGMNIRKWSSNSTQLVKDLSADQLDFKCAESRKTLGLRWNPSTDMFTFQNKFMDEEKDTILTKRELLSNISKIFDPLGWLAPLTVRAKLLFQSTWTENTMDWDEQISEEMNNTWLQLKQDFQNIELFEIPRYFGDRNNYQIHGFCDASEKAYACAIYIVSKQNNKGETTSKLVTAKTKLAPAKTKITLPRLELCGAVLLSRLMKKVLDTISDKDVEVFAWTDSMVVLGWIHGDINRWKQFVANRIQLIIDVIRPSRWHHVKSEENAADCATRGLSTSQLKGHVLWWRGPEWLSQSETSKRMNEKYPIPIMENETRKIHTNVNTVLYKNDVVDKLLNECSSIERVVTTMAWLARFTKWLRNKGCQTGYLTWEEKERAYTLVLKSKQAVEYEEEIAQLERETRVRNGSKLLCLNPYIDDKGILRVGGRLRNSPLSYSAKHPAILPSHGRLTELIIQQAHKTTNHGGPRLTLSYLREKYWIVSGLRTVKREIRKCVKCRRYSTEKTSQLMADLPQPRVTPSRPFSHTGVDFTGHFDIKVSRARGVRSHKGYVAVFVCLSTKAVHLELVSDLTTQAFLAAFRRFCARRGTPSHVYSDNGTNFVGANRLLRKEYQAIIDTISDNLLSKISDMEIQWRFNAPGYPSAGGLWEAAVKSFKYHLKRVVGEQTLTFEEFNTVLHQIEACLNSRPLMTLTENVEDEFLTPGHFLIGSSLISRPQTNPDHMKLTARWQLVQNMNKQFWKSWSTDYLQTLQARSKWKRPTINLKTGDIVLIKDDLPPGKWALGRIVDVHPGKDGLVRIASVKTKNKIIKRPIIKLCVLSTSSEQEHKSSQQIVTQQSKSTVQNADIVDSTKQTETADTKKSSYTCNTRRSLTANYVSMVILLCICAVSTVQGAFNITQLGSTQDVYYDKVYDISIIRDDWKLILYYNTSTYWTGINDLVEYVAHFEPYLHNPDLPRQYKSIIYQLQHEVKEIEHYNVILKSKAIKRQKRGLMNVVGSGAHYLFGILDDDFAKKYEKDIEKITYNERHLQQLLKNQTSIIEVEYNILHRNEDVMNKQFKNMRKYLYDLTLGQNRMKSVLDNELHILSSLMAADIIISNIRVIQQNLINVLTDLSNGHLDVHMLPPKQLEEQINIICSNLPSDLILPVEKENLEEIYKIMKVKVKMGANIMIIETTIPLVSKETLQLDRVIGLPHKNYITETKIPYLAFNLHKDLLLPLTESDVQSCYNTRKDHVICSIEKPIYELQLSQSICNLRIHNKTLCQTIVAACEERWIKLHNTNRWLYTCCEKCDVRIFCPDDKVRLRSLNGNGIIDIGQGCSIKGGTFTITGHKRFFSQVQFKQEEIIIPEISVLNQIMNTSTPESPEPLNIEEHEAEWKTLKVQIENLKQQANAPLTVHDIHHYSALYSIVAVLVIAGTITVYFYWRKRRGNANMENLAPATFTVQCSTDEQLDQRLPRSMLRVDKATSITSIAATPRSVRLDIPHVDGYNE